MPRSSSLALVGVLFLTAALAGCASGGGASAVPSGAASDAGSPDAGSAGSRERQIDVAWLDGGSMVAVLSRGSSSCVPLSVVEAEMPPLQVALMEGTNGDTLCTRDYVLRGDAVPVTVDPSQDLEVRVTASLGEGDAGAQPAEGVVVNLPGVPGLTPGNGAESGAPSAGWTTAGGALALLTWGSSGCRPVVQEAAVSTPGEITVSFAEPPADQICTMDFAPRVTVVEVADATPGEPYELVLTGDGFAGERVPVAGTN